MSNTRHKIIIGIDYGTTFSGVSYVTTDKSDIDDITINSSWPGEQHAMWKTPTRIAYARENPQIDRDKWGFEVKPKHISYSWTKLLLDKNAIVGEHDDPALSKMVGSGMLQLPPFRLAVGVCEDFLHEVYVYISKKLRQQMTSLIFDSTPMECWITLPAIWSDEAKDATLVAAQRAGFGNRIGDEVFTIAEPEAAAIATLKKFSDPNALNAVKTSPRLEFDELHVGIGGKCGATYIDRNLHTLLSERFGPSFDDLPFAQKGPGSRFMIAFETYKRDFGLSDDRDVREIGPIKLELPDSEHYDEEERMVKLTYEDMQTLFDPVVSQITSLISQQVKEIKVKRGSNIDRVVLVGGFAESPYLHNALENWCWQNGDITLIRPEHSQSAVVRGAALRGLEGIAPRMKRVRRHYGFIMGLPFREGIDPEEKAYYRQLSNEKLCDGRVKWLISKGDEVVQGTSRTVSCQRPYTPGREMVFEDDLYSSSLVDAPEHTSHPRADKVGVIKSIFPPSFDYGTQTESRFNTKLGKLVHEFRHEIQVVFGGKGSNLTFKNIVAGKVVSAADIQFDQR